MIHDLGCGLIIYPIMNLSALLFRLFSVIIFHILIAITDEPTS